MPFTHAIHEFLYVYFFFHGVSVTPILFYVVIRLKRFLAPQPNSCRTNPTINALLSGYGLFGLHPPR
jgi:hypothetical protein